MHEIISQLLSINNILIPHYESPGSQKGCCQLIHKMDFLSWAFGLATNLSAYMEDTEFRQQSKPFYH